MNNTVSQTGKALWVCSLLILTGACSGNTPSGLGVHDGKLAPCPGRPNCVLSQSDLPEHAIAPIAYDATRPEAFTRLKQVLASEKGAAIETETPDYLHATFTSRIFRFVDDVEFFFPDDARVIHVRSASRTGYSDLGVNRKRVERIRAAFNRLGEAER